MKCEKTESLRVNAKSSKRFKIDTYDIEEANKFTYSSSVVTSTGGVGEDLKVVQYVFNFIEHGRSETYSLQ